MHKAQIFTEKHEKHEKRGKKGGGVVPQLRGIYTP